MPYRVDSLVDPGSLYWDPGSRFTWVSASAAEFLLQYTEMFCLECVRRDCDHILRRKGLLREKARDGRPQYFETAFVFVPYSPIDK